MARLNCAVVAIASLVGVVHSQPDDTPCSGAYDQYTGTASCNGVDVNLFLLLCGDGFDQYKCSAEWTNTGGEQEKYFIMGAGGGISASQLPQDCSDNFQDNGLALVQYYPNNGGCYPAADLQNSVATYTAGSAGALESVTITFATHNDGNANRDGYVKVTCASYTTGFTTDGDTSEASKYEIMITAPCGSPSPTPPSPPNPGPPSPPPPPGPVITTEAPHGKAPDDIGLILTLVGILGGFSYMAAGFMILWKVKHKEGSERIPHKEFWIVIPGLVKDGCQFSYHKIRAKIKGEDYASL